MVGLSVLPAVLYVGAVASDGAGTAPGALTVGGGVGNEPLGKGVALLGVGKLL